MELKSVGDGPVTFCAYDPKKAKRAKNAQHDLMMLIFRPLPFYTNRIVERSEGFGDDAFYRSACFLEGGELLWCCLDGWRSGSWRGRHRESVA